MKLKKTTLILMAGILACWLGAGLAQAAEFSALVVSRSGSQESQGKVYFQGEKMRQEVSTPEGQTINIARPDKQVMWMVLPGQKMYMEMPFQKSELGQAMAMPTIHFQSKDASHWVMVTSTLTSDL